MILSVEFQMTIETNFNQLLKQIAEVAIRCGRNPKDISLVAVSKGRSIEEIRDAYLLGVRDFGENRVGEALEKMKRLPPDIRWHFIGKLQKNKIPKVIGHFHLIQSVETVEVAKRLSEKSLQLGVKTAVLLEVNSSGETTKGGLSPESWKKHYTAILKLEGIEVNGLMTLAPFTEDKKCIRHCFSALRHCAEQLEELGGSLAILSMGMSNDFCLAIEEGATHVRIGTALFMPQ